MIKHVLVIGGGIAGLSTAYYLQQQARDQNLRLRITLVERDDRLGGKILTDSPDGFVIEGGPDSFISQKPQAAQLARELGLGDQLMGTNDDKRRVFIRRHNRLRVMPDGLMLIVPTRFLPFALSPLISLPGKLRMGMDLFIRPRTDDADESIADFMRRRLGREALDVLGEPMLAGIHVSDAETLSLKATFPRFIDLERKYGSLTRGMIAGRRQRPAISGKKTSLFLTLRGGLCTLIDALARAIDGDLRTGLGVTALDRAENGYSARLSDGSRISADAVVLATPSYIAADLLGDDHPALRAELDAIRYVSTATVSLGFDKADFGHPLDGFGYVTPRSENSQILACTWTSTKFSERAPDESVLLRAFIGGPRRQELVERSDDALIGMVRDELAQMLGVAAQPTVARVFRWRNANPQYDVGHLDRIDRIDALTPPGVYLTGSAYRGVGIPDCIKQAQDTAARAVRDLAGVGAVV